MANSKQMTPAQFDYLVSLAGGFDAACEYAEGEGFELVKFVGANARRKDFMTISAKAASEMIDALKAKKEAAKESE